MVGSPLMMGNVPLCLGHVAVSETRATGRPLMSDIGHPVITWPPLDVVSPTTIHFRVMYRSVSFHRRAQSTPIARWLWWREC